VLEEVTVFDSNDGLHHARRDLLVGDETSFRAVIVFGESGDELGLELVGTERGTAFCGNALDYAVGGVNGGAVCGVKALGARFDKDIVGLKLEGAEFRVAVIASLTKVVGDGSGGQLLAATDLFRCGIDLGDAGEDRASSEPLVHDVLVMVVEVTEDQGANEHTT
jgi:hypothetical protein